MRQLLYKTPEAVKLSRAIRLAHLQSQPNQATSIVVTGMGKVLLGLRRDTKKWTLPGGKLESGEVPLMGALRELYEETGLTAPSLTYLNTRKSERDWDVHIFKYSCYPKSCYGWNDPDNEVEVWQWVDYLCGLPLHVVENLQHNPNFGLIESGLL